MSEPPQRAGPEPRQGGMAAPWARARLGCHLLGPTLAHVLLAGLGSRPRGGLGLLEQDVLGLDLFFFMGLSFHVYSLLLWSNFNVFLYIPAKQVSPPKLWNLVSIRPYLLCFGGFLCKCWQYLIRVKIRQHGPPL
jgi:hypothetical protein